MLDENKGTIIYFIEINLDFAFSRCLNGTFPWSYVFLKELVFLKQEYINPNEKSNK